MSICHWCRRAAEISSKNVSELREAYENAQLIDVSVGDGTFENYLEKIKYRSEDLHGKCKGGTHCFCQHRTESVVRDFS